MTDALPEASVYRHIDGRHLHAVVVQVFGYEVGEACRLLRGIVAELVVLHLTEDDGTRQQHPRGTSCGVVDGDAVTEGGLRAFRLFEVKTREGCLSRDVGHTGRGEELRLATASGVCDGYAGSRPALLGQENSWLCP